MGLPESRPFDQRYRRQQRWSAVAFYFGLLLLVSILSYFLADGRAPQERVAQDAVPAAEHKQYGNEARTVGDDRAPENRGGREAPPATRPARASARSDIEQKGGVESDLLIRNVRVFDEDHHVVYRGDVDLAPTLERIERGVRLRFSHDGIVFKNRERRLPTKPSGYYHEFVQPTPGESGPGAQRVVLGRQGEVYYSSDHYRSFRRIR